jgi:hypothetical protein
VTISLPFALFMISPQTQPSNSDIGKPTSIATTKPCHPAMPQSIAKMSPICPAIAPSVMAKLIPIPA